MNPERGARLSRVEGAPWWHVRALRLCVRRSGESHCPDAGLLAGLRGGTLTLSDLDLAQACAAAADSDAEAWREAMRRGLLRP